MTPDSKPLPLSQWLEEQLGASPTLILARKEVACVLNQIRDLEAKADLVEALGQLEGDGQVALCSVEEHDPFEEVEVEVMPTELPHTVDLWISDACTYLRRAWLSYRDWRTVCGFTLAVKMTEEQYGAEEITHARKLLKLLLLHLSENDLLPESRCIEIKQLLEKTYPIA